MIRPGKRGEHTGLDLGNGYVLGNVLAAGSGCEVYFARDRVSGVETQLVVQNPHHEEATGLGDLNRFFGGGPQLVR